MKKILMVLTGGTIGSEVTDGIINVTENSRYKLLNAYEKEYGKDVEFEVISPVNILSENLRPCMWETLFREILSKRQFEYSGIIIAHGTDTLSYTSAAAGMLLGFLSIPVVLIGSGKPIGVHGSNGLINLRNAVCLIRENVKGVFMIYSDMYGINKVYLATRILEADGYNDNFLPFGNIPYGVMDNGHFAKCENKINDFELTPIDKLCEEIKFDSKIMIITPYPGLDYDMINLSKKPDAILHTLYHSATADEQSFKEFAERCRALNIDLYMLICGREEYIYKSTKNMLSSSVIPIYNMTKESAYIKLHIAYSTKKEDKSYFIKSNIYHEIIK